MIAETWRQWGMVKGVALWVVGLAVVVLGVVGAEEAGKEAKGEGWGGSGRVVLIAIAGVIGGVGLAGAWGWRREMRLRGRVAELERGQAAERERADAMAKAQVEAVRCWQRKAEDLVGLMDGVPLPFWVVDAGGRFEWVNRLMAARLGPREGGWVGQPVPDWLGCLSVSGRPPEGSGAAATGTVVGECEVEWGGEGVYQVNWWGLGGGRRGGLALDRKGQKRAEEALRKHEEERSQLEARIQESQKLESLGILAGGIAHDFNNLLTTILGRLDLALLEMAPGAPCRSHLVGAQKASRSAAELCKQMLAYSGRGRFQIEAIDLKRVVEDMGPMLSASISKRVLLRYNLAASLPRVEADAAQIRQVVLNLVINAAEAIGEKSGLISISTGCKHCTADELAEAWPRDALAEGTYVYLEVTDTGCGMDAATRSRVFEPFFTTKFAGRGLGLAAVLGIVRGHHGAIAVESQPGQGSTFRLYFPPGAGMERSAEVEAEVPREWRGRGTILLVDDEEGVLATARNMLEWLGYEVMTAVDGRLALEVFRAHAARIQCVILDLTMPNMDGEEAFGELRRLRSDLPVILSSGYDEHELAERFAGRGMSAFIQKPYAVEDLVRVLKGISVA